MKQGELHLQMEILAQDFRDNPCDEIGDKLLESLAHIIENNEMVLIDGIPSPVNPTVTVPSGYYAKDGRFYFHIFSSKKSFDESSAANPMLTHMEGLMKLLEDNRQVGGFSLNQKLGEGTILLTREDIADIMEKMK